MKITPTQHTRKMNQESIKWIASLRGLLVAFVFASHNLLTVEKDFLFTIGKVGVAGFFLISGYLAINSIQKRTTKQFLFNRFVRLYPVYWIILLLTYLTTIFINHQDCSITKLLANATFFQQYLRIDNMINSSWMLSIMVIFFIAIAIVRTNLKKMKINFVLFSIGALICSYIRFRYNKPFPTAIFLMSCVGFLGYFYHAYEDRVKKIIPYLVVFEITLIISGYLSYKDMLVCYLFAYNGGIALFYIFKKFSVNIKALDNLGKLGFTFFLGARIPADLLHAFVPSLHSHFYIMLAIHFILCILFSYLITNYIENPMLRKAKEIEKQFSPTPSKT